MKLNILRRQSENKSKKSKTCFLDPTKILLATSSWSRVQIQVARTTSLLFSVHLIYFCLTPPRVGETKLYKLI